MPKALGFEMSDCVASEAFDYKSIGQMKKAKEYGVELVFAWSYRPKWAMMPKYVRDTVSGAGYEAYRLGSSTYRYSVWGLKKKA